MATVIVGIDSRKLNSSADSRDMPEICPAAMVDMERLVPGKTAERIWQAPIQTACTEVHLLDVLRAVKADRLGRLGVILVQDGGGRVQRGGDAGHRRAAGHREGRRRPRKHFALPSWSLR